MKDKGDPNSPIYENGQAGRLAVQMAQGPGDATESIVRALPDPHAAKTSQEEVLRQYTKQAESALAREEVPSKLKKYVRDYFVVISVLERSK